jgi:hypothetical protein
LGIVAFCANASIENSKRPVYSLWARQKIYRRCERCNYVSAGDDVMISEMTPEMPELTQKKDGTRAFLVRMGTETLSEKGVR